MKIFFIVVLVSVIAMHAPTAIAHRSDSAAIEEAARVQGDMQRDIRSMQAELTELRNLIERQQFELSKVKREQAAVGSAPNQFNSNQPRFVTTENGLEPIPNSPSLPSSTQTGSPVYNTQSTVGGDQTAATGQGAPGNTFPQPDSTAVQTGQFPTTEERILNPSSPAPSQPEFAPVEERQIGGAVSQQSIPNGAPLVGTVAQSASPAIVAVPMESIPAQSNSPQISDTTGGGVIALPNSEQAGNAQIPSLDGAPSSTVAEPAVTIIDAVMDEATLYQSGFDLVSQEKHAQAIEVFTQQLEQFPYGENADDANYWIAELKLVNGEPDEAKKYYKVIMEQYRQSTRVPFAMLRTAYIEHEKGNKMEARLLLQDIMQFHPRSDAAIQAKNRLAELDS